VQLVSKISDLCGPDPPTSQTDGQSERETDRQTTCNLNTALCTVVHCAVKTLTFFIQCLQTFLFNFCSFYPFNGF